MPPMSTDVIAAIAVALGAGWASGLNTYAAVLVLGAAQRLGLVALPHDLQVLASPWVMGAAAILFALNFFADKIPYIDSINDMLQTFVRVPAGALLAYGAAGGLSPEVAVIAGLLGGTLAAGTHVAKTGTRALINTSPEPFSNIAASLRRGHRRDRRAGARHRPSDHIPVLARPVRGAADLVAAQAGAAGPRAVSPAGRNTTKTLTLRPSIDLRRSD